MRSIGRWLAYITVTLLGAFIGMVAVGTACTPIFRKGTEVVPSPAFSEGMINLMNDGWSPANRCGLSAYHVDLNGPLTAIVSVGIIGLFVFGGYRIARKMIGKGRT